MLLTYPLVLFVFVHLAGEVLGLCPCGRYSMCPRLGHDGLEYVPCNDCRKCGSNSAPKSDRVINFQLVDEKKPIPKEQKTVHFHHYNTKIRKVKGDTINNVHTRIVHQKNRIPDKEVHVKTQVVHVPAKIVQRTKLIQVPSEPVVKTVQVHHTHVVQSHPHNLLHHIL